MDLNLPRSCGMEYPHVHAIVICRAFCGTSDIVYYWLEARMNGPHRTIVYPRVHACDMHMYMHANVVHFVVHVLATNCQWVSISAFLS